MSGDEGRRQRLGCGSDPHISHGLVGALPPPFFFRGRVPWMETLLYPAGGNSATAGLELSKSIEEDSGHCRPTCRFLGRLANLPSAIILNSVEAN